MTPGSDLTELDHVSAFDLLSKEVAVLVGGWMIYTELFESEATVAILNRTAEAHFGHYQDILLDDILLGICRLQDEEGKRRSLCLATLVRLTKHELEVGRSLRKCLREVRRASKRIHEIRNERIAHRDLDAARGASPRLGTSREEIRVAIDAIVGFINAYSKPVRDAQCVFAESNPSAIHALHLAYCTDFVASRCKNDPEMSRALQKHARRLREDAAR